MTLAQLRYAITVANSNSMNEAARTLFISQPSLSSAIRELEEEIGVELFRRTNRGISVTPEGEEFLGYARQVVEQYALIESKYISKEQTKKKFSVSMQHYTFAVNAFVEMVKQFGMDEYEFAVHETRTYDIITDVKDSCTSMISTAKSWRRFSTSPTWNSIPSWNAASTSTCGKGIPWPTAI